MLNDEHIYAAQMLLKRQFPNIEGFQDTLLSEKKAFRPFPFNSIQILYTDKCHWVTSTSLGGIVTVYDSLFTNLSQSTVEQLHMCYNITTPGKKTMNIEVPRVQKQHGTKDCGLFAIASSYEIAVAGNTNALGNIRFDQKAMRRHLLHCFEVENMEAFPKDSKTIKLYSKINVSKA